MLEKTYVQSDLGPISSTYFRRKTPSWHRLRPALRQFVVWLVLLVALQADPLAADSPRPPEYNVFLLIPGAGGRPLIASIAQSAQEELSRRGGLRIRIEAANVDLSAENDAHLGSMQREWFRLKYRNAQFDLIVALGSLPLVTGTELRDELWPNIPIVFCCTDKVFIASHSSTRTTGIFAAPDWKDNLHLARQLFPHTRHVALIGGVTPGDQRTNNRLITLVQAEGRALDLIDLTKEPFAEQLFRASKLPSDSVIMFASPVGDVLGNNSSPLKGGFREALARQANAPVFFYLDSNFSSGGLGGYMVEPDELGKEVGDLALSILGRETSPDAAPSTTKSIHLRLSWPEIERWHIPDSLIPEDAVFSSKPPSLWEGHKDAVLVAGVALAIQFIAVVFLSLERRRRRKAQNLLASRLRFETLLAEIASGLTNVRNEESELAIQSCVEAIGTFFGSTTASIWEPQNPDGVLFRTYLWADHDTTSRTDRFVAENFEGTIRKMFRGETVKFSKSSERDTLEDSNSFLEAGILSFLAVPLQNEDHVIGFLSLIHLDRETSWEPGIVSRLSVLKSILGGLLLQRDAAKALLESESIKSSLLESVDTGVAVVDKDGKILQINKRFLDPDMGPPLPPAVVIGANYRELYRNGHDSHEAFAGIQSVLDGSQRVFEVEYESHPSADQRWYRMSAMRLRGPAGGAIFSRLDITEKKMADLREQEAQEKLVLINRASEVGQLAASLAHELAQPLGAVLSNAQAALRMFLSPEPNLAEIQNVLTDIVEDDQRAREVVNNIRSILKKQTKMPHGVDLNEIARSVLAIAKSSAEMRRVQMRPMFLADSVIVWGTEVPLQQVLLNLINNAMEAMSELPQDERVLTVTIGHHSEKPTGLVVVEDQGPGTSDELKSQLFTPFFTTKSDGLGVGLTICRSLLETMGGSIRCEDRLPCGARFVVEIPLDPSQTFPIRSVEGNALRNV